MTGTNNLRIKFCALLVELDKAIPYKLWNILGCDDDVLWKLLQFDTYGEFFKCLEMIGFVGIHNRHKKPYFLEKEFGKATMQAFCIIHYGGQKSKHLGIGQKKGNHKGNVKRILASFWESNAVKKLL